MIWLKNIFDIIVYITYFFIPVFVVWNFKKDGVIGKIIRGIFWIVLFIILWFVSFDSVGVTMRDPFVICFLIGVISWLPVSRWRHKRNYIKKLDEEHNQETINHYLERNIWFAIISYFMIFNILGYTLYKIF